jgi:hypothetical protein
MHLLKSSLYHVDQGMGEFDKDYFGTTILFPDFQSSIIQQHGLTRAWESDDQLIVTSVNELVKEPALFLVKLVLRY